MLTLDAETLDALFPFHLVLEERDGGLRVVGAGHSLRSLSDARFEGRDVTDVLEFHRPEIVAPTLQAVLAHVDKGFTFALREHPLSLRGQFVPLGPTRALFLGTLKVDSADCLAKVGLRLSAFSAFDPTPDIVVLQRVRELQLEQLSRQLAELNEAIEQRDEFDRSANHDTLTQVLNRRGLLAHAPEVLARADAHDRWNTLIVDVDNFKSINDTYGHDAGDTVLKIVASRLFALFDPADVVARWGGDEFVVLYREPRSERDSLDLATRLSRAAQPVVYAGRPIAVSLSAGLASDAAGADIDAMIHFADLAMYEGRRSDKGGLTVFDQRMARDLERRTTISHRLEPAIGNGEFMPHFQPIVDLRDGTLLGLEALARWHPEDLGPVSPVEFIEIAEARNLMVAFDLMMIERVAGHLARWRETHPGLLAHVNLSAQSFRPGIAAEIARRLARHSLPPASLVIELTETSLLVNVSSTQQVAGELVDHGFAIELDDFGTGYSSLTHLKDIPVSGIKIDISFVRDAVPDERTHKLLTGILHIAESLSLHSVAEGVETSEQLEMLRALGCHSAQGYLFSRPLSPPDCEAMLDRIAGSGRFDLAA